MTTPDVILAFDFGLQRIGCAIGNSLSKTARPLTVIVASSNEDKFKAISKLIRDWSPTKLVVGLPFYPDGNEHEMTQRCRRFANQLRGRFNLETILVDERYSSTIINVKQGEYDDAYAAQIILEQFLNETIH